jgi:hypothetical protein
MGMIDTVADYAQASGKMRSEQIGSIIEQVKDGIEEGTYVLAASRPDSGCL